MSASMPPTCGTNWATPPSSAQSGASGTCSNVRPIHHNAPTSSASKVIARHQSSNALPAFTAGPAALADRVEFNRPEGPSILNAAALLLDG